MLISYTCRVCSSSCLFPSRPFWTSSTCAPSCKVGSRSCWDPLFTIPYAHRFQWLRRWRRPTRASYPFTWSPLTMCSQDSNWKIQLPGLAGNSNWLYTYQLQWCLWIIRSSSTSSRIEWIHRNIDLLLSYYCNTVVLAWKPWSPTRVTKLSSRLSRSHSLALSFHSALLFQSFSHSNHCFTSSANLLSPFPSTGSALL